MPGKASICPIPTVKSQLPYKACSMETNVVDLVLVKVYANNKPPIKVSTVTKVLRKNKCANEKIIAFIKMNNLVLGNNNR